MKSFARPSFFRVFDLLISTTNPQLRLTRWTHDGVEFERERHSFSGPKHGLTIEIITLTRAGRRAWSLMVTKEYWWAGAESKAFKNLRWARPLSGQRSDILAWMRAQESGLDGYSRFDEAELAGEPPTKKMRHGMGEPGAASRERSLTRPQADLRQGSSIDTRRR